ncbi:MAG: hypothetical protein JW910_04710, partial [Anaerolineae bacterium]|nr:hypothetical protein [Anaerolineae bacterium]
MALVEQSLHPVRRASSLRWRLPLSYMAIVLLTVAVLSGMLLLTLDEYYGSREHDYLLTNAREAVRRIAFNPEATAQLEPEDAANAVASLAFLSRARVRLLDPAGEVVVDSASLDSGSVMVVSFAGRRQDNILADITFLSSEDELPAGIISLQGDDVPMIDVLSAAAADGAPLSAT